MLRGLVVGDLNGRKVGDAFKNRPAWGLQGPPLPIRADAPVVHAADPSSFRYVSSPRCFSSTMARQTICFGQVTTLPVVPCSLAHRTMSSPDEVGPPASTARSTNS